MITITDVDLVDQISLVFKAACREQDWEVAEFLLQALEAIAGRERNGELAESAYGELLEHLPGNSRH